MSVMNRKMFNRNARNRLNSMGGIASFQTGGATRNPQLYFQPSQQGRGFANRGLALKARQQGFGALSPLEQMALKTELTMQGGETDEQLIYTVEVFVVSPTQQLAQYIITTMYPEYESVFIDDEPVGTPA